MVPNPALTEGFLTLTPGPTPQASDSPCLSLPLRGAHPMETLVGLHFRSTFGHLQQVLQPGLGSWRGLGG